MHTPPGINGNGPNANTTPLLLCISRLNNDFFFFGLPPQWLKQHHPHLAECRYEAASRCSTRERCLCTSLTVPAPRARSRLPSPLPVSSNRILFSYVALFLKRLPQCSQSHHRIPIQLKDTNRRKPTNVPILFFFFFFFFAEIIIHHRWPGCCARSPETKWTNNSIMSVFLNGLFLENVHSRKNLQQHD